MEREGEGRLEKSRWVQIDLDFHAQSRGEIV